MQTAPNLMDFLNQFPNEEAAVDYLIKARWGDATTCPKCGTMIYSDQWRAYNTLKRRGYGHGVVNHSERQYVVDGVNYTQNIENVWSQLKRSVFGVYHQISPKHLQLYCNEVEFRYNTRHLNDGQRFDAWMKLIEWKRLTYDELIGR